MPFVCVVSQRFMMVFMAALNVMFAPELDIITLFAGLDDTVVVRYRPPTGVATEDDKSGTCVYPLLAKYEQISRYNIIKLTLCPFMRKHSKNASVNAPTDSASKALYVSKLVCESLQPLNMTIFGFAKTVLFTVILEKEEGLLYMIIQGKLHTVPL